MPEQPETYYIFFLLLPHVVFAVMNIEVICEVTRDSSVELLINQYLSFENGAIFNWKPVQVVEDWCDSRKFSFVGNNSG